MRDERRRTTTSRLTLLGLLALGLFAITSCTDTNLYSPTRAKAQADRLTLKGRVCTEDPVRSRFPVRLILLVDRANGPLFAKYDPGGRRVQVLQDFVKDTLNIPKTSVAVIGYGARPTKLAPKKGNFTKNPGKLFGALGQLSISRPCAGGNSCRDYREALRSARALVEGDIATLPAGARVLTQYVVLMVNGGQHKPLLHPLDCCAPDDAQCRQKARNAMGGQLRNLAVKCEKQRDAKLVSDLKQMVKESGAGGLRFHAIHLAASQGNVMNGKRIDKEVEETMKGMAFAGGGTYQRFNGIGGLNQDAFELLGLRTVLHAKLLMASNHNALPGPAGPKVDSDADGMPDKREKKQGLLPTSRDSDGDAISDKVETLVDFDPKSPDDPKACKEIDSAGDTDIDGLTNCDEALLGTSPTLVDTDGDAMPDLLEVQWGTDYLNRDADEDTDGDGVNNGDEIRQHTDPRSTDTQAHLTYGYRYQVDDEGFVTDIFASQPDQITGVEITEISEGTTAGIGTLKYASATKHLQWKDANDMDFGLPQKVDEGGTVKLPSGSFAPVQEEDGKRITVKVDPKQLPPRPVTETIRITSRQRQCLNYTIRNIQMMPTKGNASGSVPGDNDLLLYFAESPEGNFRRPGPFRRAQIPVRFNPPDKRQPPDAILQVDNQEFVRPEIQIDTAP